MTLAVSGRVLVIGSDIQDLIRTLKNRGHEAKFANDAVQGLAQARRFVPAFVLLSKYLADEDPQLPFLFQQIVSGVEVSILSSAVLPTEFECADGL